MISKTGHKILASMMAALLLVVIQGCTTPPPATLSASPGTATNTTPNTVPAATPEQQVKIDAVKSRHLPKNAEDAAISQILATH